ncbi:MAG: hypothetical protein MUO99_06705, partial [Dehalococcoidales bacterium]|nr:hypothetical protein [Dehalococcoidales bacterium]
MYSSIGPYPMQQLSSTLDADEDDMLGTIYDWHVIRRLPRYLKAVKWWMIFGGIGMFIRTLASLVSPYLVAIATDRFIQTGDLAGLNMIVAVFVGAALVTWGGQYLETRFLYF